MTATQPCLVSFESSFPFLKDAAVQLCWFYWTGIQHYVDFFNLIIFLNSYNFQILFRKKERYFAINLLVDISI